MEKNKAGPSKTPCICNEDSDENLNDDSKTATAPNFQQASENLKKHLETNQKCNCTYEDGVKVPNRVSRVVKEDVPPECICESINEFGPVFDDISSASVIPPEEPKKKKKSFGQTLKYLVTCSCCKDSEESKPEPESASELEFEDVDTEDSGIISLIGRAYSEVSYGADDSREKSLVLEFDVADDLPVKGRSRKVMQDTPARAKTREVMQDLPVKSKTREVPEDKPVKVKTNDIPPDKPAKVKTKDLQQEKPPKPKIKEVPQEKPAKMKNKEVMQDKPATPKTKHVPQEKPAKVKTKDLPPAKSPKPKPKDVTPTVSFRTPLPKRKVSIACICTEDATPKNASKSSSRVSEISSKVKCKCTEPEATPSGQLIATTCMCGQLTPSEASLASGYTIESKASKPNCCYPEKSEELIRKIEYQRPSQYSYTSYDQPQQTYGRETPSVRSVYSPSTVSYADSNQYMPEEDDISLNEPASTYSYRQSTSVIPSRYISDTAAGSSQPETLYQRLVKRFWLESILYRAPYEPPSRAQSAPSYVSTISLHLPAWKSQVKKPTTKSNEKECCCSKIQPVTVPSKESKQTVNVEQPKVEIPKAETTEECICIKKSVSKTSKEVSIGPETKKCHCFEVLYMSKSPSKAEEKVLSKTDDKVSSKAPTNVSAGTSKDQSKSPNGPATPAEDAEAKLADENESKSSSNSSVVTVIDTYASEFEARPVNVKKSTELQAQMSEDAENPRLAGTSTDQSESPNVPPISVTLTEETEPKLPDENESKSSSNSSVVTVIDTYASGFEATPVNVKKSTEIQEQMAEDAENPSLGSDGKTDDKVLSKAPFNVSAGTSTDQSESPNVPPINVIPTEKTEAKLPDENESKSRPVNVKKSTEIQEQMAEDADNPPLGNDGKTGKTDHKVFSKAPFNVSAGTSKDQSELQNVPTNIVTPAEDAEAKLADENESKSSSNSSVVTVIDTYALQVPSGFDTRPVNVKIQEQMAKNAENPPLGNDGKPGKTDHKVFSKAPFNVSAGTSKDQSESPNVPDAPAEETKAKLADENESKSRPVNVKKPTEIQEQMAEDTDNPSLDIHGCGWWQQVRHLVLGSTVVGATAIGAYQYFK